MNGIALLQELVRQRFRAYPVPDSNDPNDLSCLVYLRGWRTGVLDTVIVRSYDDAQGFRTCNVDPSVPILRANGITLWHRTGSPADVAAQILELPPPVGEAQPIQAPRLTISRAVWAPTG